VATDLILCEKCGVEVTIEPKYQSGIPCENLYYDVIVKNTGTQVDNFDLSYVEDGWPDISIEPSRIEYLEPFDEAWAVLTVHVPEDAEPCTEKEIIVIAESECCDAIDNDNAIAHVTEYQIKENMPDLGQHCINWCWTAAAANSFKWFAEYRGYIELLDDPENAVFPDNNYLQLILCPWCGALPRLLHEIALDALYPGVPENQWPDNDVNIWDTWCTPVTNVQFFDGLREFISEQGAPLYVHEIVDNTHFAPGTIPPEDGENVIYDQPTFENYKREIRRCQDVLLQLDFRNAGYESDPSGQEALDHIVTGVSFYDGGPGNQWIEVADPWTPVPWPPPPGGPDHNNVNTRYTYEVLPVLSVDPFVVLYTGESWGDPLTLPVQVVKLIYISPENLWTGTATFALENMYKVSVDKNLQLNTGKKLVVKFYKYDNVTLQAQSVIDNWVTTPHLIIAKENVPHPLGTPVPPTKFPAGTVQIAKLVLTENNTANEISEIANFVVHQSDLRNRYIEILIAWAGCPACQPAFRAEIIDILLQWASAPP
jgi:hypothetical protein